MLIENLSTNNSWIYYDTYYCLLKMYIYIKEKKAEIEDNVPLSPTS